ncbi:MAG: PAS domain S-box protein [Candidatus Cloacimonadota bacterium]|nr:PAS domain S-box protein [Candidatus Cloacimonadota bacterium]
MKKMNLTVLYVEDEHIILKSNAEYLNRIVKKVYFAKNGEEGLAEFKKNKPELVITDIKMPKMNGLEMVRKILQEDNRAKIILVSAYRDTQYFLEAINLNVEKFLVKPMKHQELASVLNNICKKISLENKLQQEKMIRKKIEDSLLREKIYLEQLFENSPEAILIIEKDSNKVLKVNSEFSRMFGFTKEEVIGKLINGLVIPQGYEKESSDLTLNLAMGEKIKHESVRKRKDGTLLDVSILGIPIKSTDDKNSIYLIYRNITERKSSERIQNAMRNIAKSVNTSENIPALLKSIQNHLGQVIDTTNFYVALYQKETDTLTLPYQADEKDKYEEFPAGRTLTAYVIKTAKSLLANRKKQDELFDSGEVEQVGTPSEIWLGVPLIIKGEVIGVVAVQDYEDANRYSIKDMEMLEFVSKQVAQVIELKQSQEELSLEQAYLEELFESSPEAIVLAEKDGSRLIKINSEFTKMFGYTSEEAIGHPVDELIVPENLSVEASGITDYVGNGKQIAHETVRKRKDGTLVNVSILGSPIRVEGGQVAVYGIYRDISERKKAEAERDRFFHDVSEAKKVIEEKNQHIMSSIRYAEKIQQAMLPRKSSLKKVFGEYFVIFKPRDIVSGDFYWFSEVEDKIFFAVIDCTGHGVPGAFMSIISNSILNQIVMEKKIFDPALILEQAHRRIVSSLRKGRESAFVSDGMDVCLLMIEKDWSKITYSGAKRPLLIARKNADNEYEIHTFKGNRYSVGRKQRKKNSQILFTNKNIEVNKGDMIYLTTDGFVDQSNPEIKKYGTKKLKNFLKQIARTNCEKQKNNLLNELKNHMQNEPQRDDISLAGIRIMSDVPQKGAKRKFYKKSDYSLDIFRKEFAKSKRHKFVLSCVMIRIDSGDKIYNSYGQYIFDEIIKELAEIINQLIRIEDVVGTYGDEIFMMMLPNINLKNTYIVAERARKNVESHKFNIPDFPEKVTISLGITDNYRGNPQSIDDIINNLYEALKIAEKMGSNRTGIYKG